jgi:hypothetical protein
MAFAKAAPQQAFVKMTLYGPPGSGKTMTSLLMAEGLAARMKKRIAFIDSEHGTDFYARAIKARTVHPAAFDFDAVYTRSLAMTLDEIKRLDTATHGVVVIDSISHLWESAMDAYTGNRTKQDGIPMQAWGQIKKPYKDLMKLLIAMPAHVLILGRQKNVFENDADDKMVKVGVAIRAEGETQYEPHISARLEQRFSTDDQTQSKVFMFIEKDRSSVLHGRTIVNPTFATILPVLDVLTDDTQAPAEDEAERIAADSAIVADEAAAKVAKSQALYEGMNGALLAATDQAALGVVVASMKKQKKHLLEEHVEALRLTLQSATTRINEKAIGGI